MCRKRCSGLNKICQWSICRDKFTIIWLRFAEMYCTAFASGLLELFHLTFPYFIKFFWYIVKHRKLFVLLPL